MLAPAADLLEALTFDSTALSLAAVIDANWFGQATHVLPDLVHRAQAEGGGPLEGLDPEGVPEAWLSAIAAIGVPLANGGALRWQRDLLPGSTLACTDGRLTLPCPERVTRLSGPALRPARRFIASRLGFRLQGPPGVRVWLWPCRLLALNLLSHPVAGFVHGPLPGQRHGLALRCGEPAMLAW